MLVVQHKVAKLNPKSRLFRNTQQAKNVWNGDLNKDHVNENN